jgi:hypothetical protein
MLFLTSSGSSLLLKSALRSKGCSHNVFTAVSFWLSRVAMTGVIFIFSRSLAYGR